MKISDIKLHEATEPHRQSNVSGRIEKDKYLMNPVIVAKYDEDYVLIDGANRYSSLKNMGCKLILAQIIDYKDKKIKLLSWDHFVYNFDIDLLKEYCREKDLPCRNISFKQGSRTCRQKLNTILAADIGKEENILVTLSPDFPSMLQELFDITGLYFKKYRFDRSESEIKFTDLNKFTRIKGTLFRFPEFTKEQIVEIANSGLKVPAGITRNIIVNRVLHVKYKLNKLMDDNDLEKKNDELKNILNEKIDSNKVRQYNESVIVFDE